LKRLFFWHVVAHFDKAMTSSKLCVVAFGETLADLRHQRDAAVDADLVELRLDALDDIDVDGALAGRRTPVVVTCRAPWEGGRFRGSEEERHRILSRALTLGAEYVDIEWKAGFTDLLGPQTAPRVVLSYHDFDGVPADLTAIAQAMHATGVGIVKLATMARRLTDNIRVLESARDLAAAGQAIFIAMGDYGEVSRICAVKFGSPWTYAGSVPGIGQLSPKRLRDEYRLAQVTRSTAIYGIVGLPVSHSVSPAMHNAAFRATGIDAVYVPLPAMDADDFVTFAHGMKISGASVTIPYKVELAQIVHDVDPVARRVGAINTIRVREDRWEGMNSDVAGFLRPLRDRGIALEGARATVLGAGGAARAVVTGLSRSGAAVTVSARQTPQALALADRLEIKPGVFPPPPGSWDLLVNCTPVGMHPGVEASPLEASALTGRTVYDLVYNPAETRLLREAAQAGCTTIGGLDMLVAQAQDQFEWWTGTRPEADVMRTAALARLAEFRAHENHLV
jgi:3-dehydroquinate dehydratase / shikimate dehydrogenase